MKVRRVVKVLTLMTALTLAGVGFANAHENGGNGGRGWGNGGGGWGDPSPAPELDPAILGSGLALLAGGVMLLNERRRSRK